MIRFNWFTNHPPSLFLNHSYHYPLPSTIKLTKTSHQSFATSPTTTTTTPHPNPKHDHPHPNANHPNQTHHHHHPSNHPRSIKDSFLNDPSYLRRYRDPSRHDHYTIPDHHHPHQFRIHPTSTDPRRERLNMEDSWLSSSPSPSPPPPLRSFNPRHHPPRIAICFPGSSSQYIGMGHFLSFHPQFRQTWQEAEYHLNRFEDWFKALDLVDSLIHRFGYSPQDAQLIGGPIRPDDLNRIEPHLPSSNSPPSLRTLNQIVFNGPQNQLTQATHAQPAILITSIAYLKTLEVEARLPLKSLIQLYAGHSSGEYTACVASDSIDLASGIMLTRLYGLLSNRSIELHRLKPSTSIQHQPDDQSTLLDRRPSNESKPQMSALLINLHHPHSTFTTRSSRFLHLIDVIHDYNLQHSHDRQLQVEIASFNSTHQIVLSGTRAGVLAACARLHELEIANRAADLPCSSPFHSSFMNPASDGMMIGIESIQFSKPTRPILIARSRLESVLSSPRSSWAGLEEDVKDSEVKGLIGPDGLVEIEYIESESDLEDLQAHLSESIRRPVWWSQTIDELMSSNRSLQELVFIGPGKALYNLCKKQLKSYPLEPPGHQAGGSYPNPLYLSSLATLDDFQDLVDRWSH